ncbi:riboflavin synthase [Selaginella moellendorffii]|nr:riboflavin synthase [Selaginella moellendorffii]|eukprot:XP_002972626.2 riboflavin synthase [Selaginella moellendorffii]
MSIASPAAANSSALRSQLALAPAPRPVAVAAATAAVWNLSAACARAAIHSSLGGGNPWRSAALGRSARKQQHRPRARAITAMFTGIVEEMGRVRGVSVGDDGGCEMTVEASIVLDDVKLGDSIAVNGTCLTVTAFDAAAFTVGLSPETLRRTSLGEVSTGSQVNLERSLQPSSRMGGHFVQGHVDGTGTIVSMEPEGNSLWIKVRASPDLLKYIVPKGYIAVDGTSLTVVDVIDEESSFTFMLVGFTQQKVVIPGKAVGNRVNLEVDILGKYVERMLQGYAVPAARS